ncbi:MAG TPA: TIGR03790 family protein, partial [Chthoniobacterales bacterium]
MKPRLLRIFSSGLAVVVPFAFAHCARADEPLQPATIVVYNSNVSESAELAKFYAQKRGIARDHLVALDCSTEEEISREDYDRTIANPLRNIFRQRNWWTLHEQPGEPPSVRTNSIKFVALIKGMPLKVRGVAEPYAGDKVEPGPVTTRNDASVDSEIAVLASFSRQISGAGLNPYFQSYRSAMEALTPSVMLVCRLDAPSAATVRRMITDAIEAEKTGLWGRAYVDGAHNTSGGLAVGDAWLGEIVQQFRTAGVPTVYDDQPTMFPDGYPMTDAALYYGWYAQNVA